MAKKVHFTYVCGDHSSYSSGKLSSHQQVMNKLDGVLTFFTGSFKEEFGKTRSVNLIFREMGAHCQVLESGSELFLHMSSDNLSTSAAHIQPISWNVGYFVFTWDNI